jgi:hypothetical protein
MGSVPRKEIIAQWIFENGKVHTDANGVLIKSLIEGPFIYMSDRDGGWVRLYRDPSDEEFWELYYPNGGWHGGGPQALRPISKKEIQELYGSPVQDLGKP